MKLIVGLGNPGAKYQKTRHNAGFMAVERLASAFGFDDFKNTSKFNAEIAEGMIESEKVLLVKPQTYMNLSGFSVQTLQNYYKLSTADILVIYDEVEIPIGSVRIRPTGSSGGHNGIASVMRELGTMDILRVRIGIKPENPFKGSLEDYVLGNVTAEEKEKMDEVLEKFPDLVKKIVLGKIEEAMNEYN